MSVTRLSHGTHHWLVSRRVHGYRHSHFQFVDAVITDAAADDSSAIAVAFSQCQALHGSAVSSILAALLGMPSRSRRCKTYRIYLTPAVQVGGRSYNIGAAGSAVIDAEPRFINMSRRTPRVTHYGRADGSRQVAAGRH